MAELDEVEIADHEPLQVGHRLALQLAVRRTDNGILAEEEISLDLVVEHVDDRLVIAVIAADARQPFETVIVVCGGGVAPPRLQQADEICVGRGPESLLPVALDRREIVTRGCVDASLRHRQVAGKQIEQRGNVGRSLDARVASQGEDAAAGTSHIPKEQLDDRCATDVLHADGVLRPTNGVDPCGGPLAPAVGGDRFAHLGELIRRHAADLLDHLRRVSRVVTLQYLKDAERVFQAFVAPDLAVWQRRAVTSKLVPSPARLRAGLPVRHRARSRGCGGLHALVRPARRVIRSRLRIEAREEAAQLIGVLEVLADDRRSVRVADDVLAEVLLLAQDVVDDAAKEGDIAAGAYRDVCVAPWPMCA